MDHQQSEQVSEIIASIRRINAENQQRWVQTHPELMQDLVAQGKFYTCQSSHSLITVASLELAQIAYVVGKDLDGARAHLAVPLSRDLAPSFNALALLVQEGIDEQREWDGIKMSLGPQSERLFCYLLLKRTQEVGREYALVDHRPLFLDSEEYNSRAVFNRHLIYAIEERYGEISQNDYAKAPVKKSTFFYGAHLALDAIARGDEAAFAAQIADCTIRFKKRKRSIHIAMTWGFGIASNFCFDVVGTALYRLAVQRGLRFPAPDARWYPESFWRQ